MNKPSISTKEPLAVNVDEGQTYYWCSCGKSKSQPLCDGSHQDTEFSPIVFNAEKSETVYLCGCKQTGNQPFCDGTHSKL